MPEASFIHDLALVLGVAAATCVLTRLAGQPSILGYLLAGVIVGPYIPVPLFADPHRVEAMAEFGVVLVMFGIGLEFRMARLLQVIPVSGLTGLLQVSFLAWCGITTGQVLGWSTVETLFLAASLAISSTMIVNRVFQDHPVTPDVRRHVYGVLVIQDVVAIALITGMTGVAVGRGLEPDALLRTLSGLAAVLAVLLVGGLLVVPRVVRRVLAMGSPEISVVVLVGICFLLAVLAQELGYSVALGAFIAGILVAESGRGSRVATMIDPVRNMFAAVFFVSVGMSIDPGLALKHLPLSLVLAGIIITGQFLSVAGAGLLSGLGLRRAVVAGISLGQIGEFSFIISRIGVDAGVVQVPLDSVLVTTAVLTAFSTPLLVSRAERLAGACDRALPRRARYVLGLYESWLESWRRPGTARAGRPAARAVRAVALDAVVCLAVLGVTIGWIGDLARLAGDLLGVPEPMGGILAGCAALALILPFLAGIVRNTLTLGRIAEEAVLAGRPPGQLNVRLAARTLRAVVHLSVLLGVGLPAIVVLRPVTGTFLGSLLLGAAFVVTSAYLWWTAGAVAVEFHSGARRIAEVLARRSIPEEREAVPVTPPTLADASLVPGLDTVFGFRLPEGSAAEGKTLADLDLRARTGATVVAIRSGQADLALPTGGERLQAGDVLAIAATRESYEQAVKLLVQGRPAGETAPSTANPP